MLFDKQLQAQKNLKNIVQCEKPRLLSCIDRAWQYQTQWNKYSKYDCDFCFLLWNYICYEPDV